MAFEVKTTGADEYGAHVKALIAGEPGSGKTRGGRSWPDVLYVCTDPKRGLRSIAADGLRYLVPDSVDELREIGKALMGTPEQVASVFGGPVRTVEIDTIDQVQRMLATEKCRTDRKEALAKNDFGWLGDRLRSIVRGFTNLEMNVIFTVHVKTFIDEQSGKQTVKPQLQGSMADEIAAMVDLALLIRAVPVPGEEDNDVILRRYYQTYPDERHPWIKDGFGKLPTEMPLDFETDYERFYDAIYGGLKLPQSVTVVAVEPPPEAPSPPEPNEPPAPAPAAEPPAPAVEPPAGETVDEHAVRVLKDQFPGAEVLTADEVAELEKEPEPKTEEPAAEEPKRRKSKAERAKEIAEQAAQNAEPQLALAENAEAIAGDACTECGTDVDAEQKNVALMRFGSVLCTTHFAERKAAK